ncbi:MAG: hypothetical protein AAB385_04810, partial [Planctomycetota bacterium]
MRKTRERQLWLKNVECRMSNDESIGTAAHSTFDLRYSTFDIRPSTRSDCHGLLVLRHSQTFGLGGMPKPGASDEPTEGQTT